MATSPYPPTCSLDHADTFSSSDLTVMLSAVDAAAKPQEHRHNEAVANVFNNMIFGCLFECIGRGEESSRQYSKHGNFEYKKTAKDIVLRIDFVFLAFFGYVNGLSWLQKRLQLR